jgi:hypothetical protein
MKDELYYKSIGYEVFYPKEAPDVGCLIELIQDGYAWAGEHHKQWFFEQIAAKLGIPLAVMENNPGIPP